MAKEKGGLSGFLFGNVNESGELDIDENDGFFDKDLKKDLELFAKKGHISLKNLGIDEDESSNSNSSSNVQAASSIVIPDKNARDYEDEEELAEEVYNVENEINRLNADKLARQAEANIAQLAKQRQEALIKRQKEEHEKKQQAQQHKKKKKKEKEKEQKKNIEDFDFDEEAEEEEEEEESSTDEDDSDSGSDLSESEDEEKKKKVTMKEGPYEVVKLLLEAPTLFSPDDLEFKTFISGKSGEGLILKFSQVFAPKIDKPIRKKSNRRAKPPPPPQLTNESLDNDEISVWNTPSKKQAPPKKPYRLDLDGKASKDEQSLSATTTPTLGPINQHMGSGIPSSNINFQEDEDDYYVPEPMKDKQDQELLDTFYDLPDTDFQCLQQTDWEDEIIWDGDDLSSNNNNNNNKLNNINQQQQQQHIALSLFYLDPIDNTISFLKISKDDNDNTTKNNNNNNNNNSNNSVMEIEKDVNLDNNSISINNNVDKENNINNNNNNVKNKPRQLWGSITSDSSMIGKDDNLQIHNGKEKSDTSNNNNNNSNNDEDIKFGDDLILPKSEKEKEKEKKEKKRT